MFDGFLEEFREGNEGEAEADCANGRPPPYDLDRPYEGADHVGKRFAEKTEEKLEKLLSEELANAFACGDFANNRANFQEDERYHIAAGIEAAAAYLPDPAEPAAKPAMRFARQYARTVYDIVAEFTDRTGAFADAPAQRATFRFCRVS